MTLRATHLAKPRANHADVQTLIDQWKLRHPSVSSDRGAFRQWVYLTTNSWLPPKGPFDPGSWTIEDVAKCRAAVEEFP